MQDFTEIRKNILCRIETKGGLLGYCAGMYKNDPALSSQFINECFEQAVNANLWSYLGRDLVMDIITCRNQELRIEFRNAYTNL